MFFVWEAQVAQDQRRLEDAFRAVSHRLEDRDVAPDVPATWFKGSDLTAFYPELGLRGDELVATDCVGVPAVELLRFFDHVVVRLDAVPSEEIFQRLYFSSVVEMRSHVSTGRIFLLRTSEYDDYPAWYAPLFDGESLPQNNRPVIFADMVRGSLLRQRRDERAFFLTDAAAERYGRDWRLNEPDLHVFRSNIRRLAVFGFSHLVDDLLMTPAPYALLIAYVANNILVRPFSDSAGGVTFTSSRDIDLVRSRSATAIDLFGTITPAGISTPQLHPDLLVRRQRSGVSEYFHLNDMPAIRLPGERLELFVPGLDIWNFLRASVQPLASGLEVTAIIGDRHPDETIERVMKMPGRREAQWYIREALAASADGDFERVATAYESVRHINKEMEDFVSTQKDPKVRQRFAYAAALAKRAIKYIPFVGSLLDDAFDLAAAGLKRTPPQRIATAQHYFEKIIDRYTPAAPKQTATIFPMFVGLDRTA